MCRKAHKTPPCETCPYDIRNAPKLSEDNQDVWEFYLLISNQLRTSFGGVLGFDYGVILQMFDICGIDHDEREFFLNKLRIIENVYLEHLSKKQAEEERKRAAKPHVDVQTLGNIPKTITGNR